MGLMMSDAMTKAAYARNGNQHNPTIEYSYTVMRYGRAFSSPLRRLRDAIEDVEEAMKTLVVLLD